MPTDPSERIGSGQSANELAAADWWVRHRIGLHAAGHVGLAAWIVLSWGYGIWTLFDAYALSYPKEAAYTSRIARTAVSKDADAVSAPAPLEIGGTQTLSDGNRQHLFAPVNNANPLWWAEVRYRFTDGGDGKTPLRTAALLPGETRLLTELGWDKAPFRSPSLSIEETVWKRIDPALAGHDYAEYRRTRLPFVTEKAAYQSDIELEGKRIGRATFTFRNPSGYAFRNVELLVTLYRDGSVAGIGKLVLPRVDAGLNQDLQLSWPENPAGITRVEVQPFANILDPATFAGTGPR